MCFETLHGNSEWIVICDVQGFGRTVTCKSGESACCHRHLCRTWKVLWFGRGCSEDVIRMSRRLKSI